MSIKAFAVAVIIAYQPLLALAAAHSGGGGYYHGPYIRGAGSFQGYYHGSYRGLGPVSYLNGGFHPGYYVRGDNLRYQWKVIHRVCIPNCR